MEEIPGTRSLSRSSNNAFAAHMALHAVNPAAENELPKGRKGGMSLMRSRLLTRVFVKCPKSLSLEVISIKTEHTEGKDFGVAQHLGLWET